MTNSRTHLRSLFSSARRAKPTSASRVPDPTAKLVVSGEKQQGMVTQVFAAKPHAPDYEVYPSRRRQTLVGFGGAFNEKGWEALKVLSAEARQQVLRRVFASGEGLSFGMGRVPIGASDYALSRYALNETPGDLEMRHFSIDRDRQALIPYIKAAQAVAPNLRLWASAWSPPPWMKDNQSFDSGKMMSDPAIYAAYALYLAKFVEAYRAQDLTIEAVAVQNEPGTLTAYPSCDFTPEQYRVFVRDHLGPLFAERNTLAKIILGTFNQPKNRSHAVAVLKDPVARAFVGVLGLQWSGLPVAAAARKIVPDLPVWQTETDCGNHYGVLFHKAAEPQNDFAYAVSTWRMMRRYFAGGASVYTLWNIVLDETGKSIDAVQPWPQNSPIVVDRATGEVTYTPMFYACEQLSRFVGPGAAVIEGAGTKNAIAFAKPDGTLAVALVNAARHEATLRIQVEKRAFDAVVPPRSFATLLVSKLF